MFLSLCTSAFQLPGLRASTCFSGQPKLQAVCVLSCVSELLSSALGRPRWMAAGGRTSLKSPLQLALPLDKAERQMWGERG